MISFNQHSRSFDFIESQTKQRGFFSNNRASKWHSSGYNTVNVISITTRLMSSGAGFTGAAVKS